MDAVPGDFAALRQLLAKRPPRAPGERCDYCSEPLGPEHDHLIDLQGRRILCSCRACAIVFEPAGAAHGRYKRVPHRYVDVAGFALDDATWDLLQIPIGLAFFFFNSRENRTVAMYPGPAGAVESELDLHAWSALAATFPPLAAMQPDVEAAIVLRRAGASRCFVVPIDAAYRLVGLIRTCWRGFDGGTEAWERIGAYFDELAGCAS